MNERIKALAERTGGEFYTGFAGSPNEVKFKEEDLAKFAQLIVRECAQLVQGVPVDTMGYNTADRKIKEHFGVK